jgi:DNA-binding LacI/PurR family transcriptional regulator
MKDVAEKAGVSVTTVSHAINMTRNVNEDTRQRILRAMAQLSYQPNAVARSLRRKRTFLIGALVPDSSNPYFAEVAKGIEDFSYAHKFNVILCNTENSAEKELDYTRVLLQHQVDGIILVSAAQSVESVLAIQARSISLVIVDRESRQSPNQQRAGRSTGLPSSHRLRSSFNRMHCWAIRPRAKRGKTRGISKDSRGGRLGHSRGSCPSGRL